MENYNNIMKNIEKLGEKYYEKYLNKWIERNLPNNWWEALKFFFSHSFMRGRREELSNEYYHFTFKTLEDYFSITNEDLENSYKRLKEQKEYFNKECILKFKKDKNIGRGNSLKNKDFEKEVAEKNPIVKLLTTKREVEVEWENETYRKKIHLGNEDDVMMVLDVLAFISKEDEKMNIYNYICNRIKNYEAGGIKPVYDELIKMRAIADKIATFIIRDIMLMNPDIMNSEKNDYAYKLSFPVDTWVFKIANKLGYNSKNNKEIKNYFIDNCRKYKINPFKFAAGLWYLGFHSLDILLEYCLEKIEI